MCIYTFIIFYKSRCESQIESLSYNEAGIKSYQNMFFALSLSLSLSLFEFFSEFFPFSFHYCCEIDRCFSFINFLDIVNCVVSLTIRHLCKQKHLSLFEIAEKLLIRLKE